MPLWDGPGECKMSKGDIIDPHTDWNRNDSFRRRGACGFALGRHLSNRRVDIRQTAGKFRVRLTIFCQAVFTDLVEVLRWLFVKQGMYIWTRQESMCASGRTCPVELHTSVQAVQS